jgi:hypothetical protein
MDAGAACERSFFLPNVNTWRGDWANPKPLFALPEGNGSLKALPADAFETLPAAKHTAVVACATGLYPNHAFRSFQNCAEPQSGIAAPNATRVTFYGPGLVNRLGPIGEGD